MSKMKLGRLGAGNLGVASNRSMESRGAPQFTINPSEEERLKGFLEQINLQEAVRLLKSEGFCILEGLLEEEYCQMMERKLQEDYKILSGHSDRIYENYTKGNVQQVFWCSVCDRIRT